MGIVGEACLPSNAYYPRTPDYTLYSGVHICWSEHSDSSFVYGFMNFDYGLGTMNATTILRDIYTLSGEVTMSKSIFVPSEKLSVLTGKHIAHTRSKSFPYRENIFQKGIDVYECKCEVSNVIFLVKMVGTLPSASSPCNTNTRKFRKVQYDTASKQEKSMPQ